MGVEERDAAAERESAERADPKRMHPVACSKHLILLLMISVWLLIPPVELDHIQSPSPSSSSSSSSSSSVSRNDPEVSAGAIPHHGRCEKITISLCKDIRYNETIFPNLLQHQKQDEAALEVHPFGPLVKVQCSPDLQFFLCSVYAPVCTILEKAIPPCRSLCLSAKHDCEVVMNKFGYRWPEQLDCNKWPDAGTTEMCVGDHDSHPETTTSFSSMVRGAAASGRKSKTNISRDLGFRCPLQFQTPLGLDYRLLIRGQENDNCGAPCDGVFFDKEQRRVIRIWNGIWSTLCVVSTLFTLLTFLIDRHRFKYPERPIIFLSLCYLGIGLVYLVGSFMGDRIACNKPFPVPPIANEQRSVLTNVEMVETVTQGNKKEVCTFLFMSLYFCTIANSIWWVILTFTWFLAAGLKWGNEAIESNSHYFHLVGWAVPAILTITVLALGKIEGDVLSGVCYAGFWNQDAIHSFVSIPILLCLMLGSLFLVLGLISLFQIRTLMKREGSKTEKLEKLILRIGCFSALYILPTVVLLSVYHMEYTSLDSWITSWLSDVCMKRQYGIPCPPDSTDRIHSKPPFTMFLIKYLATVMAGITSGFWVASEKTLQSWTDFYRRIYWRICCMRVQEEYV